MSLVNCKNFKNILFFLFSPVMPKIGKDEIANLDINLELELCFNPSNKITIGIGNKKNNL